MSSRRQRGRNANGILMSDKKRTTMDVDILLEIEV